MATLRLAFLAGSCALLLAASAWSSPLPPPAAQRDVPGRTATVPPAGNGTEATQTLTQWAESQLFHVGDILDFKSWNGTVLLLARRGDYERCGASTTASPPWRFAGGGGATKFELNRPRTFYFVSGVPGRCEAGQRMAVRVREAPFSFTSGVVAPAPDDDYLAVPPSDDTTTPPPPPPPPATVVFKVTTSAWLWVATVGIFVGVLLFVIFYCVSYQAKLTCCFLDKLVEKNEALSNQVATV